MIIFVFFFKQEDGIRIRVGSGGRGVVYKRRVVQNWTGIPAMNLLEAETEKLLRMEEHLHKRIIGCLLYTSDAADERSSVDLGGRRIIKKKTEREPQEGTTTNNK